MSAQGSHSSLSLSSDWRPLPVHWLCLLVLGDTCTDGVTVSQQLRPRILSVRGGVLGVTAPPGRSDSVPWGALTRTRRGDRSQTPRPPESMYHWFERKDTKENRHTGVAGAWRRNAAPSPARLARLGYLRICSRFCSERLHITGKKN
ncbi:hypothetical protein AAFF_G00113850 [Aldrovandia affinis]|uniref:Uncharacterized protein n=1 Tax=Aldrovandia affinis TaxID=143900 RepID=A0AAD7RVR6_9TELE|nr:hypothetical protein AAFF_G00113850 [Aldrovandia affinis]